MEVLLRAAEEAAADPAWQQHVTRPPEVSGGQELADGGEHQGHRLGRRLRTTRVRAPPAAANEEALDAAGVRMPNHQFDVWMRGETAAA